MRSSTKYLCAVASIAIIAAAPASAQRVERIVAFGDSYADDGNFFQLTGIPLPSVYPQGRFSNGTNFIDTMGQLLGVPIDNFAIGGAFTGTGNTGFSNINGGPTPQGMAIPGFPTEVQSFLAGGGPAAFPRVSGTFGPNDLLAVSIGGNDARYYEKKFGAAPSSATIASAIAGAPAAAAISVTEATAGLNALANAGARNISFIAGDVGRLPEVRGTPIAAIGSAFASSFNSGMQAQLSTLAANGVTVNYLDLNRVGDSIEADPAAFGLTSAGACPVAACSANPALFNQYFFYVDQVHLSSAGFAIVGRYAVRQLEAPLLFEAQTDIGLSAASAFGRTMGGRLDLGGGEDGLSTFVVATSDSHDVGSSMQGAGYDYNSFGVTGGVEYRAGGIVAGAALGWSKPKARFNLEYGEDRAEAYHVGAYAAWKGEGPYVQASVGSGWLDYDLARAAVIDTISASPDGRTIVAEGEAGFLMGMSGARVGPFAAIRYGRAKVDAYTESGDAALTLNVDRQRASQLVGQLGLALEGEIGAGGLGISHFVKLSAEKQLDGSQSNVFYANAASPTIVNEFELEEASRDVYGRIEAGASFALMGALSLEIQANATFEHPEHNQVGGFAGLKLGF